jgi:hypothetical protein
MKTKLNKKVSLITLLLATFITQAQERDAYADKWNIVLYQRGSFKQNVEGDISNDFYKMRQPTLELNYISDMFYINAAAGTSLVYGIHELVSGNLYQAHNSPLLEFGWGFNFNTNNPFKIAPSTDMIIGMGFNLGGLTMMSNRLDYTSTKPSLKFSGAFIGPTLGANIQIGNRINLQNVLELSIAGNGTSKGTRFETYSNINFFITKNFALSVIPTFQKYNIKEEDNGFEIRTKSISKFIQYGLTFKFN